MIEEEYCDNVHNLLSYIHIFYSYKINELCNKIINIYLGSKYILVTLVVTRRSEYDSDNYIVQIWVET